MIPVQVLAVRYLANAAPGLCRELGLLVLSQSHMYQVY